MLLILSGSLWDSIGHYIVLAFITVTFIVALLLRVLCHQYRLRRRIEWRNYRKMTAQLSPISAFYILLQLLPMILCAAYSAGLSRGIAVSHYSNSIFFRYWVILFTPFTSVMSLSELKKSIETCFYFGDDSMLLVQKHS
jgi:hypothetical protein